MWSVYQKYFNFHQFRQGMDSAYYRDIKRAWLYVREKRLLSSTVSQIGKVISKMIIRKTVIVQLKHLKSLGRWNFMDASVTTGMKKVHDEKENDL